MAITTLSGVSAGLIPSYYEFKPGNLAETVINYATAWGAAGGFPSSGAYDSTLNGVILTSSTSQVTGQIPFYGSSSVNVYLARFAAQNSFSTPGFIAIADRLWHNGGITTSSSAAQTIVSPTFPARDANGNTNGVGVILGLEVSATVGAATPSVSVGYTNSAGTSGRVCATVRTMNSATAARGFYPLTLQSGDVGVQRVDSITFSSPYPSGTLNLVAYRPLAIVPQSIGFQFPPQQEDAIQLGLPRMYNGSVPYLFTCRQTNDAIPMVPITYTYG